MKKILILVLIFFSACSTGPNKQNNPCDLDTKKLCSHVIPGDGRLGDCMTEHKQEISKECARFIDYTSTKHDEKFGPAMTACEYEHNTYCGHVKKYSARRLNCMKKEFMSSPEKLSEKCRKAFSEIFEFVPPVFN